MATATTSSPTTEPKWVTRVLSKHKPWVENPVDMWRAPENMRSAERDDPTFDPVLVSIGPFHHGKFPATDEQKIRILNSMADPQDTREFLTMLDGQLRTKEEWVRSCYSESFPEIDFVEMMILDGFFVLKVLRMCARMYAGINMEHGDKADSIFPGRWMLPALALDLIKLENQLPYAILHILHARTSSAEDPALDTLAGSLIASLCPGFNGLLVRRDQSSTHLLSLFYPAFVPDAYFDRVPIKNEGDRLNSFPSVTDLCLSGIAVKKKECWNQLEIEFSNGKLAIPTLVIDHSTTIVMRNLVAFEQCSKTVPDMFTSYVTFIDALVNSPEDVEVLRVAGVINHFMNSNEEVSLLLNSLTSNIKFDMNRGYLAGLSARVYHHHHSALPQLRARFKRLINSREGIVYIITVFGAYLTILQTVLTVLSYVLPR